MNTNIAELALAIVAEYRRRLNDAAHAHGEKHIDLLTAEEWQALSEVVTNIIPKFPNLPKPLFSPIMSLNVPFAIELVIIRNGRVLLSKRNFCGDEAYHTPGTYLADGETFLEAAQRCADRELKVRVISAKPISPPINHPQNPRFQDATGLFLCEIEGEPQAGEWFSRCPKMLEVHREYPQYINPLLVG